MIRKSQCRTFNPNWSFRYKQPNSFLLLWIKLGKNVRVKDDEIDELRRKLVDVENEGEQMELKWQEALLDLQNLKLEIEKREQEKVELDTRLQASVGQEEFDKSMTDRNKLIANLKKKLKEERSAKKEEIAKLQSSLAEKDAEAQQLKVHATP